MTVGSAATALQTEPGDGSAPMRAVLLDRFGGADALRIGETAVPQPVNAEVLVRIMAAGINPVDTTMREGGEAASGIAAWPAVLGSDFSGVVVRAPYETFPFQPGDEVYGVTAVPRGSGSLAEYAAVPPASLARKPRTLSHLEAAAVPLAAMTAWGAVVEQAKAHEGQRILIHAGSGGVGHFAVQIASYFGAHVITTGSARNEAWLRGLGADEVVDHSATRFEDVVGRVDAVVDLVGDAVESTGSRSLGVLRPGGLIVNVPSASWPTLMEDAERAGVRATRYRMAADSHTLEVVSRLITSGDLRVFVEEVFPLERVSDAYRRLDAGHVRGKLVVQVADY